MSKLQRPNIKPPPIPIMNALNSSLKVQEKKNSAVKDNENKFYETIKSDKINI
jgi:hypothetical protein